eukprot:108596_1
MEGYLMKRFIVLQNGYLYSYKNHNKTKLTEQIDLSMFDIIKLSESNLCQFQLTARSDGIKPRVFNAASKDEAEKWINAIDQFIPKVIMEGYLQNDEAEEWVDVIEGHLDKRFIVLQNGYLYSYKNHNKTELTEKIDLRRFDSVKLSESDLCQFQLTDFCNRVKPRAFNAKSMDEAEEWIHAIDQFINAELYMNDTYKKDMLYELERNKDPVFSFGNEFGSYYWQSGCAPAPQGKYKSIKHEVISNQIYSISIQQFNEAYNKAQYLLHSSPIIKNLQASYWRPQMINNLKEKTPPNTNHILSVILYTDYDSLSHKFSETFRKIRNSETWYTMKQRNGEYWNWSKMLSETVNVFGTSIGDMKVKTFYHGTSLLYFDSFIALFNSPTSTTTKLSIATIFAKNDGIILSLKAYSDSVYHPDLKCFNCSYLSAFGNEDERLFIGGQYKLQFKSILLMDTSENCIYFTKSLSLFDRAINADNLNEIEKRKVSILDYKIVNKLIKCEINESFVPLPLTNIFCISDDCKLFK